MEGRSERDPFASTGSARVGGTNGRLNPPKGFNENAATFSAAWLTDRALAALSTFAAQSTRRSSAAYFAVASATTVYRVSIRARSGTRERVAINTYSGSLGTWL